MALAPSVSLAADHPGLTDPAYRARRQEIASIGERFHSGEPIPVVRYTSEEDGVWRLVSSELATKHAARRVRRVPRGSGRRLVAR